MQTLYFGDCLEIMDELIIEGVKVDAVITDPPYGTTQCKWDVIIPFDAMWKQLELLRKDNTPIVLFGSEPFSSFLRCSNIKEFKYDWMWDKVLKTGHLNSKNRPLLKHENIRVFYKHSYYPIMEIGNKLHGEGKKRNNPQNESYGKETRNYEDRKGSIFKYPNSLSLICQKPHSAKVIHPNQKPIELLEYFIKTYTKENEIVLDFTCGSGTTGVACKRLNRNFIGIDNGYCDKKNSHYYKWRWVDVTEHRMSEIEKIEA